MAKTRSMAERISSSSVMLSGLKSNIEKVSRRGIDDDFISTMESTLQNVIELNNIQEELKGKLKEQTATLNLQLDSLSKMLSETRTVVKMEFNKEAWVKFGIETKR